MCLFVGQHFVSHFGGKSQLETCGKKVGNQQQIQKKKKAVKIKLLNAPATAGQKLVGKLIVNYLNAAISAFCAAGMCEARAAITLVAIVCLYSLLLHKSFTTIKNGRKSYSRYRHSYFLFSFCWQPCVICHSHHVLGWEFSGKRQEEPLQLQSFTLSIPIFQHFSKPSTPHHLFVQPTFPQSSPNIQHF